MTHNLKDLKAALPDGTYDELLKASKIQLLIIWAELFNKCMELGTIPQMWGHSMVKVLYHREADMYDTNKY
jgi:hypothetical protein